MMNNYKVLLIIRQETKIWNNPKANLIREISRHMSHYYHQDLITDLGGKTISFNELKLHAQLMKQQWVNTKVDFKDIISNGNEKIAVRFNMSGIKEGQSVCFEMMGIDPCCP